MPLLVELQMHSDPETIRGWDNEPCLGPWNRPAAQFCVQRRCIPSLQEGPNASSRALHLLSAALVTMEICLFRQTIGLNKYTFSWAWAATTCKHLLDVGNKCWHEEMWCFDMLLKLTSLLFFIWGERKSMEPSFNSCLLRDTKWDIKLCGGGADEMVEGWHECKGWIELKN